MGGATNKSLGLKKSWWVRGYLVLQSTQVRSSQLLLAAVWLHLVESRTICCVRLVRMRRGGWGEGPPTAGVQPLIDFLETPYGAGQEHAGTIARSCGAQGLEGLGPASTEIIRTRRMKISQIQLVGYQQCCVLIG